jgi:hypothetical protein
MRSTVGGADGRDNLPFRKTCMTRCGTQKVKSFHGVHTVLRKAAGSPEQAAIAFAFLTVRDPRRKPRHVGCGAAHRRVPR